MKIERNTAVTVRLKLQDALKAGEMTVPPVVTTLKMGTLEDWGPGWVRKTWQPTPEILGSLNDEVTRLRRLVGDLETLAAAEAAGLRPRTDPVDLADVTASAADLLQPLADDR